MNIFKILFKKKTEKKDYLYKIVYERESIKQNTLVIPANSPVDAMTTFYKMIKGRVTNIVEFTEIKYPGGEVEKEEEAKVG